MTSLPQTQPHTLAVQDGRLRTTSAVSAAEEACGDAGSYIRQALPAVDPSKEFGCVDWFLYPDTAAGEAKLERARA